MNERLESVARKILVVDDDPKMCESLSQVLERHGYMVTRRTAARKASVRYVRIPTTWC